MRLSTIITICLAVVLGGIAAYLSKVWLEGQAAIAPNVVATSKVKIRHVVVASQSLRFGVKLSKENLTEVKWPSGAIPSGSFASKDELLNGKSRSVLTSIEKNEPVLKWKITGPGQRASLSALISENGLKAITIRVNDIKGVAGFILPGDRVDIYLTRNEKVSSDGGSGSRQFTDLLLQNIKVLAVDQIADNKTEKTAIAKAVTVEVNAFSAQKLVLATSAGRLSLALRRAGATIATGSRRVTIGDLGITSVGPKPIKKKEAIAVVKEPDIYSLIGVIRGVKPSEIRVQKE